MITSKIWSHVWHRYILGFKLLSLGFYDGVSFIPIDFNLHWEQCCPKTWGDTIVFDLAHLPKSSYDVQIKIGKHLVHRNLEIEKPKVKRLKKVKMLFASFLQGWLV